MWGSWHAKPLRLEVVDKVVGEVVGRSSNPIYPIYRPPLHQVTIMMSYTYTLVVESQNPSSIPASFLIRNAQKAFCGFWWRISGAEGQELFAASVLCKNYLSRVMQPLPTSWNELIFSYIFGVLSWSGLHSVGAVILLGARLFLGHCLQFFHLQITDVEDYISASN